MMDSRNRRIALVGVVGLPSNYGGFETLADNLVLYAERSRLDCEIEVYCSSKAYQDKLQSYHNARLRYIPLKANGIQSIAYDIWALFDAARRGADTILVLGVSGALAMPLLRLFSGVRIVVNVDGLEWKRAKFGPFARWFLHLSERLAARSAHVVIGDNQAIVQHIAKEYGREAELIAYGGDHAGQPKDYNSPRQPVEVSGSIVSDYALMLCRIEPENNIDMILGAFSRNPHMPLVAVGNWNSSQYGRTLRAQFSDCENIYILDPVYDAKRLYELRSNARLYVHGHSAGGTNPSLVEMMWLGRPVLAFDCVYNRFSTDGCAGYFDDVECLISKLQILTEKELSLNAHSMREVSIQKYRWQEIGNNYFDIIV